MTPEEIFEKIYYTPKIADQDKEQYHYQDMIDIIKVAMEVGFKEGLQESRRMFEEIIKNRAITK